MAYTAIDDPTLYFNTKLYTGTGSSNAVTGVNFSPAFTWIKSRTSGEAHILTDVVRGATKTLSSNVTDAETTVAEDLKSFDSDGFTVGTNNRVNKASDNMIAWNWLAGTTSGITTNGSTTITPSAYSFNQTAGFSTLAYTGNQTSGAKLAHGLGVKPSMIICKSTGTSGWGVYHKSLGATYGILLNTTGAKDDDASAWNDVEPDTVNITLGSSINTNKTGTCVGYAFAEKQGYSKFGSYVGNANADGTFIYLGFKPAFVMVKEASAAGENWIIVDNKRTPGNPMEDTLYPNLDNAEDTGGHDYFDFLSNGMKPYTTNRGSNGANTYIYAAFSEASFVTSTGVPATAR